MSSFVNSDAGLSLNSVLSNKEEEWYISYLPPQGAEDKTVRAFDKILGLTSTEETALYSHKHGIWYILVGDWRKEYEEIFPSGYEACLEFYKSKKEKHRSDFSTD